MNKVNNSETGKQEERSGKSKRKNGKNIHVKRLNFLVSASKLMSNVCPNISRIYIKEVKEIAEKHVIRLDREVKRLFCKGCNTLLIPDKTAVVAAQCHEQNQCQVPKSDHSQENPTDCSKSRESTQKQEVSNSSEEICNEWISVTCCICTRTRRFMVQNREEYAKFTA